MKKTQTEVDKNPDDVDYRRLRILEKDLKEKAADLKSLDENIFEVMIVRCEKDACVKEAEDSSDYTEKVAHSILSIPRSKIELK